MRAAFIHSPELDEFQYPAEVPLVTRRAGLTREKLVSMGLLSGPDRAEVAPLAATRRQLETFHTPRYLDALERAAQEGDDPSLLRMGLGTIDCPVFPDAYAYPALACGATLKAAELVASGDAHTAFNPSGGYHHAGPERAAGFCYINDLAVACLDLAARGRRVFYLDVDVHHGDGVQNAFYGRADVMTLSLHQTGWTLFPGTGFPDEIGTAEGRGYCVNLPMPPGTNDAAYLRAFHAVAEPLLRAYDPDVIVLQLGMDALAGDPLANLDLTLDTHAEVIRSVLASGKPLLATGGGGYDVDNTVRGWTRAWALFCGDEEDPRGGRLGPGEGTPETTGRSGGPPALDPHLRDLVDAAVDAAIEAVKKKVFPIHGLSAGTGPG